MSPSLSVLHLRISRSRRVIKVIFISKQEASAYENPFINKSSRDALQTRTYSPYGFVDICHLIYDCPLREWEC